MKHIHKRWLSILLSTLLTLQLLPIYAFAGFVDNIKIGDELYIAENNEPRILVSETEYNLAPGVTETVTYTNEKSGLNQNIDYFCEIDLSKAIMMAGYADMEGILTNNKIAWQMQKVSDQVKETQTYFERSSKYEDYKIVAALNADFYNMATGQPTGLFMIDGVVYNNHSGSNYFAITKEGKAVITNSSDLSNLQHAVAGSALLLKDGEVNVGPWGRNVTYTAIGIKADGTVVSMVCHGQSYPVSCGYTQYEVANMMKARGCVTALMLDGSGSSTFVSRREGEATTTTRNSPSDGQERQVSNSLFIISTAESDGIFDHAALSPNGLVYTPNSKVQFSASGVDKSGGPAHMPQNVNWTLADGKFGTIESTSGLFTSNGTPGEVVVNLNQSGRVIGTTSVLIQPPDQLIFSADKVSVGFGGTSDLGLQVRYQNRDVYYNVGDFIWSLSNSKLGAFSGNLFTAHQSESQIGTATVTSKWDPKVTGTVEVEVGKEPLIAIDFETPNATILHGTTKDGKNDVVGYFDNEGKYHLYPTTQDSNLMDEDMLCVSYTGRNGATQPQVGKATIVNRSDGYPVRFGENSLRLDYDFTHNAGSTDGACFGYNKEIILEGNPTHIGVWVYIPEGTPNLWLRLRYKDGSGNTSQKNFTSTDARSNDSLAYNSDNNWYYFEADISDLQTPVSLPAGMAIRVMVLTPYSVNSSMKYESPIGWIYKDWEAQNQNIDISANYGTLYFDNLTYVFGSSAEDTVPPVVSSVTVNQTEELRDGMSFPSGKMDIEAVFDDSTENSLFNTGIDYAALYVDGQQITGDSIISGTDSLRAGLNLTKGTHIIKLSVSDKNGNETLRTYNITVTDQSAENTPIVISTQNNGAILGGNVKLDFTPKDNTVTSMDVILSVSKQYADKSDFVLTAAPGCTVTKEAVYDHITNTISFAVSGTVSSGPLATLTLQVPTTVLPGSDFTFYVTGGRVTYSVPHFALPSFSSPRLTLTAVAPYTVTSGTMVHGISNTLYFTISDTEGKPVEGVGLYRTNNTLIGQSTAEGWVYYSPFDGEKEVTVYAKDSDGGVSGTYRTSIYTPQGNEDGTPTHVWKNASNTSNSINVSWVSNPLFAGKDAKLQIALTIDNVSQGDIYSGISKIVGFPRDGSAAILNGVTVTGLTEGTTYYYRVGDGTNDHWSDVQSFTTGYLNSNTNILILGDLQESDNAVLPKILSSINIPNYDITVQTGDLVDAGGNYSHWNDTFEMISQLDTPRMFAIGNHEAEGGIDIGTLMFNQPQKDYHSVEVGNTFIASITHNGGTTGFEKTLEWLVKDAKESDATWKILVIHSPPYFTNPEGSSYSAHDNVPSAVQEAGIDVVLSGHDHSYARTEPLWNGSVDEKNGITYFICGSLGEKSYAIVDNPSFHFAKTNGDFNSLYMTLSTTNNTLSISAYDFGSDGKATLLDSFTKTVDSGSHSHNFLWDGSNRLTCSCGYNISSLSYTGYVDYLDGQAYLHLGKAQTGVFAVGDEVLHAGDNLLLHDTKTISTATCTEDGTLGVLCYTDNTLYTLSEKRRTGHTWDENHVCINEVFSTETFEYKTCGYHGRDISLLEVKLPYQFGFYNGEPKRPSVTITDVLDDGTVYKLIAQSTYGDFVPYYTNNVNVGRAEIRIEGYSDGNYYGEQTVTFDIIPNNVMSISAGEITSNSVRLTWEASSGAEEYIVYQNIKGTWTRHGIVSQTQYTVTGLEPGEHQFRIRPCTNVGGEYFYSSRNSDILTVNIDGSAVQFERGGKVKAIYGDPSFTNTATLDGVSQGFSYSIDNSLVATVDEETGEVKVIGVGTAVITAVGNDVRGQYRLTVEPKVIGLSWTGIDTRSYDGLPSVVQATATGLLDEDTVTVSVIGGGEKNAGTHSAIAVSINNSNYKLPQENSVNYSITPAQLSITWVNTSLTYTGTALAPTAIAGDGLILGDTIEFTIPKATETGTYRVSAVSKNPNYTVLKSTDQECIFTINMPRVIATGIEGDMITSFVDGTVIYVRGIAADNIIVTATAANGSSASSTVSIGSPIGSVTLGSITYKVDASSLVERIPKVEILTSSTEGGISEDIEFDAEIAKNVQDAASSGNNNFGQLIASIASNIRNLIAGADEPENETLYLHVSMQLTVKKYEDEEYTVEILPVYTVSTLGTPNSGTARQRIKNEHLGAPVYVTLQLPKGLNPSNSTYIKHKMENGLIEYIKPYEFDEVNYTISFWTRSFSEFTVYTDERNGSIEFAFEDGTIQTREYTPENIGDSLPILSKDGYTFNGWEIDGNVYKILTDNLLEKIEGSPTAEPIFVSNNSGGSPGGVVPAPIEYYSIEASPSIGGILVITPARASHGATVTITVTPDEGYTLGNILVNDASGNYIATSHKGDGNYTFNMPRINVSVSASFDKIKLMSFNDILSTNWFYNAVSYVYENNMMNGVGTTTFAPNAKLTRGMIAQVLYNMEDRPVVFGTSVFTDVSTNAWYADAINWAQSNGIVDGYGEGLFGPNNNITREQAALILHNYSKFKGYDDTPAGDLSIFTDGSNTSAWAEAAMKWAVGLSIINGKGNDILDPKGSATRAEVAQILMNFCEKLK